MKSNKPSVQLSNVNKEWEKIFLGEISEIKTGPFGSALHAKDYVVSGTPIITTEHFKTGELPLYKAELPQVSNEDYKRLKSYRLKHGDLVFSRVGSVDINALVTEAQSGWLFSGRVLRVRPIKNVDGSYLHYLLDTTLVKNDILSRAVGQTMPSINTEILKNTLIHSSTDVREQKKIGLFFKNLDDTISLHQQELDTLKQTKQGFLQKMFPKNGEIAPKIRFEGHNNEWILRELKDVATFINGRAYKQTELLESGKYKVLRVGNFYTNNSWYYSDLELDEKYYADFGDLLYTWSASFGPHIWKGDKVIYHYHIWKVDLKDGYDKNFIVQLFEYDKAKIMSDKNGSTMVHITKKGMEEKKIYIPSYNEQVKIGEFFRQLDEVIGLKEQELEALKQTKQGFLQKMFI